MKISRRALGRALAVVLVATTMGAGAEHEANHRYIIRGYVLDAGEAPLADVPISVRVNARRMGSTHTDADGYYSLQVHLHDDNLGDKIEVRAGDRSGEVRMRGAPGDRSTQRIHFVSFVGERMVESDLGKFRLPTWGYIVAFLAALIALVVVAERLRRRRLRMKRAAATAVSTKPKRRKRKRRKAH